MCNRYFGCLLLVWFPAVLHAQSETQSCSAPELLGGVFAPRQKTYSSGTQLTYICNEGLKSAVNGQLATITCENGKWSHEAQCIESGTACGQPPTFPHAVIFDRGYKEALPADTEVVYICEDGYATEEIYVSTSIFCIAGAWTEGPTCKKIEDPGAGSSGAGTGVEGDTATGHEIQPTEGSPGAGSSGAGTGAGGSTATGHVAQLTDEGTSTSDGRYTTIDHCGPPQNLPNMDYTVETDRMSLTYKCKLRYRLLGSPTVRCNSDNTWSQLPTCRDCVAPSGQYEGGLYLREDRVIKERLFTKVPCSNRGLISRTFCRNGWIHYTTCCTEDAHHQGTCPSHILPAPV